MTPQQSPHDHDPERHRDANASIRRVRAYQSRKRKVQRQHQIARRNRQDPAQGREQSTLADRLERRESSQSQSQEGRKFEQKKRRERRQDRNQNRKEQKMREHRQQQQEQSREHERGVGR